MVRSILAAALAALTLIGARSAPAAAPASSGLSLFDLVEIDYAYAMLSDHYYRQIAPQLLLDGARTGIVAYLYGRGIAEPQVGVLRARADGRGVVPAIDRQLNDAIRRYGSRVDVRKLVDNTIRGELAALKDPYTVFFPKPELKKFTNFLNGETFGGIGVVIALDDATKRWRVDQVFENGPAARAGLKEGDEIDAIDGTAVAGLSSDATQKLLRGKVGSTVRLSVVRDGASLAEPLAVVRAEVSPPEVTSRMLGNDVGYVALRTFGGTAGEEVRAALQRLEARGARAFVFDLRGNGGGYESASVHVASAFIPSGPIVSVQENHGKRHVTVADGSALPSRPLVVLVNHDSASGSELVAAAIQDRGVGKVVGTRTFGKGLVQSMFPLPDGSALKVTTARYFTPNGRDIDRLGITPDVVVDQPSDAQMGVLGHDPQLDRALAILQQL